MNVLINPAAVRKDKHVFNCKLDIEGLATNQKQSGRCWIFAGTNVLRLNVINKYQLKEDFELSQSFLFFYDKLEKANWFLENMIDLADREVSDRVVQFLLTDPVGDGGTFSMFINIVNKYGLVPKSAYGETIASSSTSRLNWLVTNKLREFAIRIRESLQQDVDINTVRLLKEDMLNQIYRIMVIFLGEPPKSFTFETYDKNGKFLSFENISPLKFKDQVVNAKVEENVSLLNDPRNAYNNLYTVDRLGNVVDGLKVLYININVDLMKQLAIKTLKANQPVWFGCDVGKFSNNKFATMDMGLFDYELAFDTKFEMTKADRVLYGESAMTHAMVFTGVHCENDKPVRWRVQNSWGNDNGDAGYYIMDDAWFSEFVYQVVLNKKYVPNDLLKLLETEPTVLPAYDPMGSLA
ncbi:peptidase C1B, bleomycin hydrolase [Hesseltinella vesiculosa]|uniref:Cysteine proteinase 1, mitochondrial n=1 Tax=Hesseltinella vesiculosa TaxID=101127 RepID=A0A1X2GVW8_9FUNG|nr:peptidase C1B, bleomycin hydrolase [Hesseltinella vesiculosa]